MAQHFLEFWCEKGACARVNQIGDLVLKDGTVTERIQATLTTEQVDGREWLRLRVDGRSWAFELADTEDGFGAYLLEDGDSLWFTFGSGDVTITAHRD